MEKLTDEEKKILDGAAEIFNMFMKLPVQHRADIQIVADAVHSIQAITGLRVARRIHPDVFFMEDK